MGEKICIADWIRIVICCTFGSNVTQVNTILTIHIPVLRTCHYVISMCGAAHRLEQLNAIFYNALDTLMLLLNSVLIKRC